MMKLVNHNTSRRNQCYGGMFPDLGTARFNKPQSGKVFAVTVESRGIGIQSEELSVNEEAWGSCAMCVDFDGCYKLSMAKLAFQSAVQSRFH